MFGSDDRVWICPAACHDEAAVSSSRSRRTTSFQPNFARWNRIAQPTTPPPMTTTLAWLGNLRRLVPEQPANHEDTLAGRRRHGDESPAQREDRALEGPSSSWADSPPGFEIDISPPHRDHLADPQPRKGRNPDRGDRWRPLRLGILEGPRERRELLPREDSATRLLATAFDASYGIRVLRAPFPPLRQREYINVNTLDMNARTRLRCKGRFAKVARVSRHRDESPSTLALSREPVRHIVAPARCTHAPCAH